MKTLVFATNNLHKLSEVRAIQGDAFHISGLTEAGIHEDIPENEPTIEGNASAKSRFVFEKYGIDCFADDTGLEVDALDGRPGVHSARYAGEGKNFDDNVTLLLQELQGKSRRTARFRTVISYVENGTETLFEGILDGVIIHERRGTNGFGYDPVFIPQGYVKTLAEMSAEEKNAISHRFRATEKLISYLLLKQ
ncbi:MAG: RdgB/HAM1 family non-canonical purine NTP pyrophosphatase [Bacteroidota bacterium]